jgi:hypothetical protein
MAAPAQRHETGIPSINSGLKKPSETKIQVSDGLFISIKMRQVLKTCRGMGTYSSDGKPGSVADSHSSRHIIAGVLKQPTRTLGEQRHRVLFGLAPNGV